MTNEEALKLEPGDVIVVKMDSSAEHTCRVVRHWKTGNAVFVSIDPELPESVGSWVSMSIWASRILRRATARDLVLWEES